MLSKNATIDAKIADLLHEGADVAKVDGFVFFVEDTLPGKKTKVCVLEAKKSIGFGKAEEYMIISEHRNQDLNMDCLRTGIADLGHLAHAE